MELVNHISGTCWRCTEKTQGKKDISEYLNPCIRMFDLVRALRHSSRSAEVVDCWECRECHVLVPVETWAHFQKTGDVVVRERRRKR